MAGRPGRDERRQSRPAEEREHAIRSVRDQAEAGDDEDRDDEARRAPDERVDEPLEDERPRDPPRLRAERHLHADLARPLLDDGVHDVRDADAADEERQHADDPEEDLDAQMRSVCPFFDVLTMFQVASARSSVGS